ncbi:hypothetical protein JXC34_01550, partial [Candidatus Woesearchaeota archaeon]|nr:hypothetical protein [Candidatus Woesearchaeota archaeon]
MKSWHRQILLLLFIMLILWISIRTAGTVFNNEPEDKSYDYHVLEKHIFDMGSKDSITDSPDFPCTLINDIYLRYMCARLTFRPHMMAFMANKGKNISFSKEIPEECSGLENYETATCIFARAAETGEKSACDPLLEKGECEFYIAISKSIHLVHDEEQYKGFMNRFCSEIEDKFWREECFYLLADELSLNYPEENFDEIRIACERSMGEVTSCFNHVVYLMPYDISGRFCETVDAEDQPACFGGIGSFLFIEQGYSKAKELCVSLNEYCLIGLADNAIFHPANITLS